MKCIAIALLFAIICAANCHSVSAAVVYDESVNGDLADSHAHTVSVTLLLGSNMVLGNSGVEVSNGNIVSDDFDSFGVTVAPGNLLVSIFLTTVQTTGNATGIFYNNSPEGQAKVPAFMVNVPGSESNGTKLSG